MGWAARTGYGKSLFRNTRHAFSGPKVWTQKDVARALNGEFNIGKKREKKPKGTLAHLPSGHGIGKWHSVNTLRRYKAKAKRLHRQASQARAVARRAA